MRTKPRWVGDLGVLAIFACLTVVMTWPMVLQLNTHFAGQDNDVWLNQWVAWWTVKAISEGKDLYYTDSLFYPHGVSLAFHSFSYVNTAIELALRPWLDNLGAYNVMILLAHVLSGYNMFCLARHVTRSSVSAFFAGLVFAFFPYRMAESVHPVVVSTQWMPLYFLFFLRLIEEKRHRFVILAAFFFVLTALSSWHLMVFTVFLSGLYICYLLLAERSQWSRVTALNLLLLAALSGLILAPFLFPMIREQIGASHSYMGVDLDLGKGNDLVAFFVPAEEHPVLGPAVRSVYDRIKSERAAYLGFTVIGLSVAGTMINWHRARFWMLLALSSILLSIGLHPTVNGHVFDVWIPWSVPVIWFFRHAYRFNALLGFALAVTSGLGFSAVVHRFPDERLRWGFAGIVIPLLLFEYLYLPFPATQAVVPDFYAGLPPLPEGGAILELPMGRQHTKRYMYYQTLHGRPLLEGHVSRTPEEAYAFIEATPALRSLRACGKDTLPPTDLAPFFGALNDVGIEYLVLHKDWISYPYLAAWLEIEKTAPDYEDEDITVYSTQSHSSGDGLVRAQLLDSCVAVHSLSTGVVLASQTEVIDVPLEWTALIAPERDHLLELVLADANGVAVQRHRYEVARVELPSIHRGVRKSASYQFQIPPFLTPGDYSLKAALVPMGDERGTRLYAHLTDIQVSARPRNFAPPSMQTAVEAAFGDDLRLLGYDLGTEADSLHVTLHWQALRRMDVMYKFFVHLYDVGSGELVAQEDTMPREWTYPTTWWEAEEVVSDEIHLSLVDVPPGKYRLAVGVYNPDTGERLAISGQSSDLAVDEDRLILPEEVVR